MYSYIETLIIHFLFDILYTINPEVWSRARAEREIQFGIRSLVRKELQCIGIRGISI
jgi:hypothetical protein